MKPVCLPNYTAGHHLDDGFCNEVDEYTIFGGRGAGLSDLLKFIVSHDTIHHPSVSLVGKFEELEKGTRVFWIGHATVLIEIAGVFIITDPQFNSRASPVPCTIKRRTPLPCQVRDLPEISVILISHCHWDHLDHGSIRDIVRRFPNVKIFAPLGCSDMVRGWGFGCEVVDFDWRQFIEYEGVRFTCYPAVHGSARNGRDANQTLWCSWLVEGDGTNVYFPGDTTRGRHFKDIGDSVKDGIKLVVMPIGPQEPSEMMRRVHLGPQEALEMSVELGARHVIPIHFATFCLGHRPEVDDLTMLKRVWEGDNLHVLPVGGWMEWDGTEFVDSNSNL